MAGGKYHFQLTTFITTEFNVDLLLHVLSYTVPWLSYLLKYNMHCLNIHKMRDVMERLRSDWDELNNAQEIEIIKKYSALGKVIAIFTTLFLYISACGFIFIQVLSNYFLDWTSSANESRPWQLPVVVEYFVDQQKYYVPILSHIFFVTLVAVTVVAGTETLNMTLAHHVCALFEIAKFIDISEAAFRWSYNVLLPLAVTSLSINLYRLSYLIMMEDYYEMIISFIFVLSHFWYMGFCNYAAQEISDHSGEIFYRTYNAQWYTASLRAQKLLLFVMQRGMKYNVTVICGLFVGSLEGFATLISTSVSYFMMILSLQDR
ncbi:uncharacterized protein LOC109860709 [Pseudomyrmex gracilis]|uniref:uncharacterized protein LOC109860709 n=1 Tax=Pseudomyrmex gracilis TaxID=219809 RepID=UPI000995C9C1|nr:uncharacterized protein LOC109860709 [Pseudomyrmex gracilis]